MKSNTDPFTRAVKFTKASDKEPDSPDMDIFESVAISQSASSVAVIVFEADANGLLCPISNVENEGTKINNGREPPLTPSSVDTVTFIKVGGISAPDGRLAMTETGGLPCALTPLRKLNVSV